MAILSFYIQEWIQQNNILSIVLRDSLHQPQYVEKLEKILRFVIKEKALTLQDLDNIWAAQVKNSTSCLLLCRRDLVLCRIVKMTASASYAWCQTNIKKSLNQITFYFGVLDLKIVFPNVFSRKGILHVHVKSKGTARNMVQRLSFLSIKEPSTFSKV